MKRLFLFVLLFASCAAIPSLHAQGAAGADPAKIKEAAERGNAEAQNKLGELYAKGASGLKRDVKEALKWYRKAADQGNARALYNLGECYDNGDGVKQNVETAVKYYRMAAEKGNADAQSSLGYCY